MLSSLHQRTVALVLVALCGIGCDRTAPAPAALSADTAAASELAEIKAEQAKIEQNLANFDDLDFNVYSNQKWDELSKSHAANIVVHWPDGRTTTGIEPHIEDLKKQFVFAPDTKIKTHPIKIAQGNWTAVTGVMEGTFSQPMPTPDGKTIPPTNKPFKLDMVTIGRWENGVMQEEWLFWDNHAFMQQIGLTK
ncbi:ester cyclase [Lysobacter sp. CFH 32150]|uniref:ester cyclase n=1 Tax=Lysobacter sp. CFH 32150 TaxID=2927128 RepID=UPI001FA71B7E|nr:ester cyclase [Lysobacter sp. CFH 32150]MCI4567698.1 ester cyclase [Lysobacter sp. CFH 32150]